MTSVTKAVGKRERGGYKTGGPLLLRVVITTVEETPDLIGLVGARLPQTVRRLLRPHEVGNQFARGGEITEAQTRRE